MLTTRGEAVGRVVDEAVESTAGPRLGLGKPTRSGARATYSAHFRSESCAPAARKSCKAFILGHSSTMARNELMVVVGKISGRISVGFLVDFLGGGIDWL